MHVVAMRKAILRDNPWIARNLFNAFEEAKRGAWRVCAVPAISPCRGTPSTRPLCGTCLPETISPMGSRENRAALQLFLRYAHEQGIAHRHVQPEDIFPPGIMVSGHV